MKDEQVDYDEFSRMADEFINTGFNYFDTAHGYLNGKSEIAIRECVSKRYDRSQFLLTNKLTTPYFNSQEDIRPFFEQQLEWCGVDYFDFYLMHAQDKNNYQKYKKCKAYETCYALKEEGLIRHFGISFHDKADVLDLILTEHPEIEIVQIQFNYVDYEDASVESRKVYEVCEKYGKPVIVMEPVKGGSLVNLPEEADKILRDLNGGSNASYAIRFAASFPNMAMVLSGRSNMSQMEDNLSAMKDFEPLNEAELEAVNKVCDIFKSLNLIPCTSCRYCIEENECPKGIRIPDLFSALNANEAFHNWNTGYYYNNIITGGGHGKASECIKCGKCEKVCPQHLQIRELLKDVAKTFEA
jgi:predicted aldo/keto reductase-like oxidoreductase